MEVMVSNSTVVLSSPKKLEHLLPTSSTTDSITLGQLPSLQNYQKVSVKVKVLEVQDKLEVKPDLYKQDVIISDATDTARLTLWQADIGTLEESKCYDIKEVMIKTYNDVTPPKTGCTIVAAEDIGAVQEVEEREELPYFLDQTPPSNSRRPRIVAPSCQTLNVIVAALE